ncbi:NnrS family protein [Rhodoferax sp.]|uniref:NnrS family protein n=1 Tax=Rhodoferax sp. TaxID=50421 RepID=UPI0027470005|nr:NnrS family protein [Rhodoferax sp.]
MSSVPQGLWSSGFRPFFLMGAAYGPLALLLWVAARFGGWPLDSAALALGHAHELLYGFATAIVCGVLLTALPGWTGGTELRGRALMLLAGLWLAGRLAWWGAPWLPPALVLLVDCALVPVLCAMLWPTLAWARQRLFLWTLPPLLALALGNLLVHLALLRGSVADASFGLVLGLHALAFLYSLYGGLLTPAFTRNWLGQRGETCGAILVPLEIATAISMVLFAAADLAQAGPHWMAAAAALACGLHAWRCVRWRGWRTTAEPLLWTLHGGYVMLIAAIALRGLSAVFPVRVPPDAWLHVFTLGALGLTMLGLMTRVVLRHTGRPLRAPGVMKTAYALVLAATLLRLAYTVHHLGVAVLLLAALLWAGAFGLYLLCFAGVLLRPSLARARAP